VAAQRQQVEWLLDAALYAPLGLALTLCERLPNELRQRRQAVENRVQLARFFGEMAVRYGKAEFQRQQTGRGQPDAPEPTAQDAAVAGAAAVAKGPVTPPAVDTPDLGPTASSLPISDYESLAAIHVVERLGSLRPDEVEQVRQFEADHRARRTILAKITQLQDGDA
jgi:hypothetical protein